jgi:hypothetical protein
MGYKSSREKLRVTEVFKIFPAFSWNSKFHCCDSKTPPLDPILWQPYPAEIHTPYLFKIHFSTMLPSMSTSLPFSHQKSCMSFLSQFVISACPAHPILLDYYGNFNWWRVQIMPFLILQFPSSSCNFLSLRYNYPHQSSVFKRPHFTYLLIRY